MMQDPQEFEDLIEADEGDEHSENGEGGKDLPSQSLRPLIRKPKVLNLRKKKSLSLIMM